VYKSLEAADHAEVSRQALIIYGHCLPSDGEKARSEFLLAEGRALIPACLIAMTKGEAAAVWTVKSKPGSFEGTNKPMIKVPQM
jgi:hypothetical protein